MIKTLVSKSRCEVPLFFLDSSFYDSALLNRR